MAFTPSVVQEILKQVEAELTAAHLGKETGTLLVHYSPEQMQVEVNSKRKNAPVKAAQGDVIGKVK